MTATDMPTFHDILTAHHALRVEREAHAATKRELQLARLENTRLARRIETLEQQVDQAQRQHMPARPAPETYYHRQL